MFKFLAKSLLATALWKRYHKLLLSTLILFITYFIIGQVHDDFLAYAEKAENSANIGFSFLLKWFALVFVTVIYFFVNSAFRLRFLTAIDVREAGAEKQNTLNEKHASTESNNAPVQCESDPFSKIRKKKKLSGSGDLKL